MREKMNPVLADNLSLKKKVKGIEEEYREYTQLFEGQKQVIQHQVAEINQLKALVEEKVSVAKNKEARLNAIAQKIYNFRSDTTILDKRKYAAFVQSLYNELTDQKDDKFKKPPEISDELNTQIKFLQEKSASNDSLNAMKKVQLEKLCKGLRSENSKLIRQLNEALRDYEECKKEKNLLEGKVRTSGMTYAQGTEGASEKRGLSLSMKMMKSAGVNPMGREKSVQESEKLQLANEQQRPASTKNKKQSASSGKLVKGPTQHLGQFKPPENERISELTKQLHESNDKIFHLKMEVMTLKKYIKQMAEKKDIKFGGGGEEPMRESLGKSDSVQGISGFLPDVVKGKSSEMKEEEE
jgi:hypothetical protein